MYLLLILRVDFHLYCDVTASCMGLCMYLGRLWTLCSMALGMRMQQQVCNVTSHGLISLAPGLVRAAAAVAVVLIVFLL